MLNTFCKSLYIAQKMGEYQAKDRDGCAGLRPQNIVAHPALNKLRRQEGGTG